MSAVPVVSTLKPQPSFVSSSRPSYQPIKPLYMWAGGKTKLLKHYKGKMPSYEGFSAYIEPFFGGGAMFCDVANSMKIDHFAINDINPEIIAIYRSIKSEPEVFIEKCSDLAKEWNSMLPADRKAWYYALREKYWQMETGNLETSATLYVLMKTCFNGVWQASVTHKRMFGTAVGLQDKVLNIDSQLIRNWSTRLQNTRITSNDYLDIEIPLSPCLIYCDPPYRGSFTSYGQDFDDEAQIKLVAWCRSMAAKGHTVILANRDCDDGFFENVLDDNDKTVIHYFDVFYTVGRKKQSENGCSAKKAVEFIAVMIGQEIKAANDNDWGEAAASSGISPLRLLKPSGNLRQLAAMQVEALIADNGMRQRDERFAGQDKYKALPDPIHDKSGKPKQAARYQPRDFDYDPEAKTCICPAGKHLYGNGSDCTINGYAAVRFQGAQRDCVPCTQRDKCLLKPDKTKVRQVSSTTDTNDTRRY